MNENARRNKSSLLFPRSPDLMAPDGRIAESPMHKRLGRIPPTGEVQVDSPLLDPLTVGSCPVPTRS